MRRNRIVLLPAFFVASLAARAGAQPIPEQSVPEPLRKWIPWVLDGAEERMCPAAGSAVVCLWPGRLTLAVDRAGGAFHLDAYADRTLDLPLPGDEKHWPLAVQLDGQAAVVLARENRPVVRLTPGAHGLAGRYTWEGLPDALPVPAEIGIVDLTVEGRAVALPRREEGGLLMLRQGGGPAAAAENLQLKVFRQIQDGIPLWVETRLVVEASGRAREVSLQGALLDNTAPVAVSGELPARLDPDRKLRVQVRPGSFDIRILARVAGRPEALAPPKTTAPWPDQEVWVFAAAERLRQVEAGGAPPIDPSRTNLPDEWKQLPAFLMEHGATLTLKEVRRGVPDAAPDQIALSRRLWLDQNGGAFTVRDSFSGTISRTSRLNLSAPGELGRAAVDGVGQLVTRDPGSGEAGVELRRTALKLEADSRLPRRGSVSAVGWSASAQSLRAELYVAPGWRLLAATGVDQVPGSWISGWNLFAFFFVLLTSFAALRVFGPRWGLLVLLTLVLLHGEAGAPRLVWLSLIGAMVVMNAAPAGILRTLARVWWGVSLLVLLFTLPPFLVQQIRGGLFPQAAGGAPPEQDEQVDVARAVRPAAPPPPPATLVPQEEAEAGGVEGGVPGGVVGGVVGGLPSAPNAPAVQKYSRLKGRALEPQSNAASYTLSEVTKAYEQDPHAVIQTGAGVPSWSWATYTLVWSGPVAKDHHMRLILLSPFVNLLLAFARVALATVLAVHLVAAVFPAVRRRIPWLAPPAATTALLAAILLMPAGAGAEQNKKSEETPAAGPGSVFPSDELLEDLKGRLLRPPACAPECVSTAQLQLVVEGATLRFEAQVHAGAAGAWTIPGPAQSWVPRSVSVDGAAQEGRLARLQDGFLHVRVSAGVHRVSVSGPLPPQDSVTLQFGAKPRSATYSAPGWQVDGIREDGGADDSVQLSRKLATPSGGGTASAGGYEPWLEVTRIFDVGVSWRVQNIVRRVSPVGSPVVVKVPLVKGMLVTDAEHQVKDNEVLISLGRDEVEAHWTATLKPVEGEPVTLKAPEGKPWSEVWIVRCGLVWECEVQGPPPVVRVQGGVLAPELRPWPGEALNLVFRRPQGVEGQTLTVDRVGLHVTPGIRLEDATLDLQVRASRPGPFTVTLPKGAEVRELKVKGIDRPIRPDGQALGLTLEAGEQPIHVTWRREGGLGWLHRAPAVGLGRPAVNVELSIQLPAERWLLLTGGPSWGPSVLFWGYLVFVLLAAALLARVPWSPLKTWEWLLLALGLSQIPLFGALVIAGWFLVLAWRRDRVLTKAWQHDSLQITLVLWTALTLLFLYGAIDQGLLLRPDMQVGGGGSTDSLLRWYQDRTADALPQPWVLSVPLGVYRLAMLSWSLWLALSLVRWLPWAWTSFSSGSLWQPLRRSRKPAAATPSGAPPPPA